MPRRPRITLDKHFHASCSHCPGADVCDKFEDGASCWYDANDVAPDLSTAEGILEAMQEKVATEFLLARKAARNQSFRNALNRDALTLSNTLNASINQLTALSIIFGKVQPKALPSGAPISHELSEPNRQPQLVDKAVIINMVTNSSEEIKALMAEARALNISEEEVVSLIADPTAEQS